MHVAGGPRHTSEQSLPPAHGKQNVDVKIGAGISSLDSLHRPMDPDAAVSFSASPRSFTPNIFFVYGRHNPTGSVIAVPRANRSLVVFREAIG
jgi:hypothetical protein